MMKWILPWLLAACGTMAPSPSPAQEPLQVTAVSAMGDTIRIAITIARAKPETVVVAPQLPATATGLAFGLAQLPITGTGALYNASIIQVDGPSLLAKLDTAQTRGARLILSIARNKSRTSAPLISVAMAAADIKTWPDSAHFDPYRRAVVCVRTTDDIMGKTIWGPGAPYFPQIDSINMLVKKQLGKNTATCPRATPSQLWAYKKWQGLNYGHAQYGFYPRLGSVDFYRQKELAAADSLHACVLFGLNVTGDADNPAMTPDQIRVAGRALMPVSDGGFFLWWKSAYTDQDSVKAAIAELRALADTLKPHRKCA